MTRSETVNLSDEDLKEAILEWYKKKFNLEGEVNATISIGHEVQTHGYGPNETNSTTYYASIYRSIKS